MENTPQFRPRILPMPKDGDRLIKHLRGEILTGIVVKTKPNTGAFCVDWYAEEKFFLQIWEHFREMDWNFADPTVEAQRLMEAAYRADTSPLPDSFMRIISGMEYRRIKVSFDSLVSEVMDTVGEREYGCCPGKDYEETRDSMIFFLPLIQRWLAIDATEAKEILLRWQAQQEVK